MKMVIDIYGHTVSGKSTLARKLAEFIRKEGHPVELVDEGVVVVSDPLSLTEFLPGQGRVHIRVGEKRP